MKQVLARMCAIAAIMMMAAGCRQRDIKETTIKVPQATNATAQAAIRAAIAAIDGVDAKGAVFTNGEVRVKYDSMKLGIKNLEHAIKDIGYDANDFKGEPQT